MRATPRLEFGIFLSPMQIVCRNCGSVDSYTTERKAHNIVATCADCGKFIKNIPYDKPRMYFGKYKGVPIAEINDLGYLQWANQNLNNISERVREAMKERINTLSNLLR